MTAIIYDHEKTVEDEELKDTILQISLRNEIPHIHACGGNARCSTCRVRVLEGNEYLIEPGQAEQDLARQRGFTPDIRLACQTRIKGPIKIRRLVIDEEDTLQASTSTGGGDGKEMKLAILFSDIRSFTPFTEKNLPYDVVHSLNRYFHKMGDQVQANGGLIDKYIGDGLMALFGLNMDGGADACLAAVNAALGMIEGLEEVNAYLEKHIGETFKIGIGIHFGDVIVGEMGHPDKKMFTALGDNVNMASRIESTTKKAKANLLVSQEVFELVEEHVQRGRTFQAKLKGKSGDYRLFEIAALTLAGKKRAQACETFIENMKGAEFDSDILEINEVSDKTLVIRLNTAGQDFAFRAGQFIKVSLPELDDQSHYFSIASSPALKDSILMATRVRDSGYKYKLSNMKPGDKVRIQGPLGSFLQAKPEDAGIKTMTVLIAGGIGVTPIRAYIEEKLDTGFDEPLYFFYSNRTPESAVFFKEFEAWVRRNENFRFIPTLTGPFSPGWKYETGRIEETMLRRYLGDPALGLYHVVGGETMVSNMKMTLSSLGVPEERIRTENFVGY